MSQHRALFINPVKKRMIPTSLTEATKIISLFDKYRLFNGIISLEPTRSPLLKIIKPEATFSVLQNTIFQYSIGFIQEVIHQKKSPSQSGIKTNISEFYNFCLRQFM